MAVSLRSIKAQDVPALHALSLAANWPHREQDCRMFLTLGEGLAACAEDGAIIASGLRWNWSANCANLGMVIVAPDRQGQGIGRHLLSTMLDNDTTRATALNATEAGLALYERLGFRSVGSACQHQGTLTSRLPHRELRRAQPADLAALIVLDQEGFGVPRAALIETLLADGEARILEHHGRPRGFAVRRRFGHGEAIGPVLAESEDAAIDLVAALLRPGFQRIDIPAHATKLAAWLTQAGLPKVDCVTAMVRGVWPARTHKVQRFALASQALG